MQVFSRYGHMSGPHASSMESPKVMGHRDWELDRQARLDGPWVGHPFGITLGVRLMIRRGRFVMRGKFSMRERFSIPCQSIKYYPHQTPSTTTNMLLFMACLEV